MEELEFVTSPATSLTLNSSSSSEEKKKNQPQASTVQGPSRLQDSPLGEGDPGGFDALLEKKIFLQADQNDFFRQPSTLPALQGLRKYTIFAGRHLL